MLQYSPRTSAAALCAQACAGLLLGIAVYVCTRDQVPALAPGWLADHGRFVTLSAALPATLTGALPSFLHAYAVLLFTAAIAGRTRQYWPAMLAGTLLCLALEAVQQTAIAAGLASLAHTGALYEGVLAYASTGVYDHYDMAGILLALAAAVYQTGLPARESPRPARSF